MKTNQEWHLRLQSEEFKTSLIRLYGQNEDRLDSEKKRYLNLLEGFNKYFGTTSSPIALFSSAGRTEIAGNHTDHQKGLVLCASVNLDLIAFARPNQDNIVRLVSEGFGRIKDINLNELDVKDNEKETSAALIRGIAAKFKTLGYKIGGFDCYASSQVPRGSGLSSSAAFEVLIATIFDSLFNEGTMPALLRAQISQYAENVYFDKPSGLMDQCGCCVGGMIALDFKDTENPKLEAIDFPFEKAGYSLIITQTEGDHSDLTDEYAAVPQEMKEVAAYFGKDVLREVSETEFYKHIPQLKKKVSDRALLRAIHLFNENNRVKTMLTALKNNDLDTFLDNVKASGISSWTLLQNVFSKKSDAQPVSLALALSDHLLKDKKAVSRVHGGGFAGTIQAWVPNEFAEEYKNKMNAFLGDNLAEVLQIRPDGALEIKG